VPGVPVVDICNWVAVNIRLRENGHEQAKIRKKRWNNKEIQKFDWKWKRKQEDKKSRGNSVQWMPVIGSSKILIYQDVIFLQFFHCQDKFFYIHVMINNKVKHCWVGVKQQWPLTQYIKLVGGGAFFYIHVII
jgi:hypothetical protein